MLKNKAVTDAGSADFTLLFKKRLYKECTPPNRFKTTICKLCSSQTLCSPLTINKTWLNPGTVNTLTDALPILACRSQLPRAELQCRLMSLSWINKTLKSFSNMKIMNYEPLSLKCFIVAQWKVPLCIAHSPFNKVIILYFSNGLNGKNLASML